MDASKKETSKNKILVVRVDLIHLNSLFCFQSEPLPFLHWLKKFLKRIAY